MDDISSIVIDTASRIFSDVVTPDVLHQANSGQWPEAVWSAVEDAGLVVAMVPEENGGLGVAPLAAAELVKLAGYHALPAPLAETMLACRLLAQARLALPAGPLSIAGSDPGDSITLLVEADGWRLEGEARNVPWGSAAAGLAVYCEAGGQGHMALLEAGEWSASPGRNLANEPRDTIRFAARIARERVAPCGTGAVDIRRMGAALRSLAMAGALERVLDMTVRYAGERSQFGKPIGRFQAIQQNIALLAGQAAAASGAAGLAAEALAGDLSLAAIASSKIRAGEAAGIGAAIAHQVHGAIGFSQEHSLHLFTRRLWSWRDEFGGEAEWSRALGQNALTSDADALWRFITAA